MDLTQILALLLMAIFYAAYFAKMLLQRKKGIQTSQLGKGKKDKKTFCVELLLKIATYAILPAELVSILGRFRLWNPPWSYSGIFLAAIGILIFVIAMGTMRDSWRAGIPASEKTELVTGGIYRISRNPAFLGFDLLYLGLLLAFFNVVHLVCVLFAIIMLHLQILQEERFLEGLFGEDYLRYKKKTGRYFIV